MLIRRHPTLRPVVIDAAVLELSRLSPAALGLFVVIAASPGGISWKALLDRYGGNRGALDARLTELKRHALIEGDGR